MNDKPQSIQDVFLNACRKEKQQVTVYLTSGVKLQGVISGFDNFSILLRRSIQTQLIYKHSVATIVPTNPVELYKKEDGASGDGAELPKMSGDGSFQIA